MAPKENILDTFDQFAYLYVTPTAAASGAQVRQLVTGLSNMQKVAWAVSRICFEPYVGMLALLGTNAHFIDMYLSAANQAYTTGDLSYSAIYDRIRFELRATPAALGDVLYTSPVEKVYAPGRELLILPQSLFLGVSWSLSGAAAANACTARIYYKEVELGPENWYDLLQLRLPLGAV